ncbi:MAG: hypothetical protein IKR26_00795 [Lachnospiraceae bacterium]|nr:hypothetical protein [Lachnospiraceae bacterium]
MKVLILGFAKLKYMPYLSLYLDTIDAAQNDITVFYFNRDDSPDAERRSGVGYHEFFYPLSDFDSKIKKARTFLKYKKEAEKLIGSGDFDYIIAMHSWPAVLLGDLLTKHYPGRFIFDYRDYTYEKYRPFKSRIDRLVRASQYIFVSSRAFLKVLPEGEKYVLTHNFTPHEERTRHELRHSPVRVRFWGLLRHENTDRAIIDALANDDRFELHFHGRGGGYIEEYIRGRDIRNVFLHGEYFARRIPGFAAETELLLNIPSQGMTSRLAVGNKLYDGAMYYVPQIGDSHTYMGRLIEKNGLGICVDTGDKNLADILYSYIQTLDADAFCSACDSFIRTAEKELDASAAVLRELFN